MSDAILGFLNLLKLRGSKSISFDGEEGVFIPYKKNGAGVVKVQKDGQVKAKLRVVVVKYKDKFGHDFMVIRAKTAWEFTNKKNTEIFGNLTFTGEDFVELDPNEDYATAIFTYFRPSKVEILEPETDVPEPDTPEEISEDNEENFNDEFEL